MSALVINSFLEHRTIKRHFIMFSLCVMTSQRQSCMDKLLSRDIKHLCVTCEIKDSSLWNVIHRIQMQSDSSTSDNTFHDCTKTFRTWFYNYSSISLLFQQSNFIKLYYKCNNNKTTNLLRGLIVVKWFIAFCTATMHNPFFFSTRKQLEKHCGSRPSS